MLNYKNGSWTIEVAQDAVTGEIDAFVWDRITDEGRYLIEDDLENDNDIKAPFSIIEKAKEMVSDVLKVI
ncbi:hypothetical protein WKH56_20615 [Priestia sp. SB1]|uniref:hypothetical protein n=1 Tax=Priestia sp. SB1 TaxID=3132359 RepID=UPI00317E50BF